jgi:hypothetical protein
VLEAMSPASSALWDIPSIHGTTALDLERRALAEPLIEGVIRGGPAGTPGLRLIDFLSVRYVSMPGSPSEAGFEAIPNQKGPVRFVENTHARPLYQFFDEAVAVQDPTEALAVLQSLEKPLLIVETPFPNMLPGLPAGDDRADAGLDTIIAEAGRYEFTIASDRDVWFFIADAPYPGWNAYLDDEPVPVYPAQLLGKAIFIPAGEHSLRVQFEPSSFYIGRFISLSTVFVVLLLLGLPALRKAVDRTRRGMPAIQAGNG